MRLRLALPLLSLIAAAAPSACQKSVAPAASTPDSASAGEEVTPADDVTLPRVTAGSTSLLFSWVGVSGRIKASARIADVPEDRRERVAVSDLSVPPEKRRADRYAFFADLTAPNADGTYPVVVVSRFNAARGERLTVKLPPPPDGAVIVYSAEWCGFCKKAKSWLTKNAVPYVERDVEKDPGVSAELKQKLEAANLRSSGVPVIDWDGELIVGFDLRRLGKALAAREAGGD